MAWQTVRYFILNSTPSVGVIFNYIIGKQLIGAAIFATGLWGSHAFWNRKTKAALQSNKVSPQTTVNEQKNTSNRTTQEIPAFTAGTSTPSRKAQKINSTAGEMLNGLTLKCPKCQAKFNPGPINLIMVFNDLDNKTTAKAPPYTCIKCNQASAVHEWYDSTLEIR
jgi:hypothetical protein